MTDFPDPTRENWDTRAMASQSQPDPAAYLHAEADPYRQPDSLPIYPSGPTTPPPPPIFPMLYPNTSEKRRAGTVASTSLGAFLGVLAGGILVLALVFVAIHNGILVIGAAPASTATSVANGTSNSEPPKPLPSATTVPGSTPLPVVQPSVTPGHQPTPPPGATPTAIPTGQATPAPTATLVPLSVTIGCWMSPDHRSAKFCVNTAPRASLSISVVDCDGVPDPKAPISGQTDGGGNYMAMWAPRKPNGGCRTVTITVQAIQGSQHGSASQQFVLGN